MADEKKRVNVLMGPYRGNYLDMPTGEGDAAIGGHWALDPYSTEPYGSHGALSDEERASALDAANAWAKAQWDAIENPPTEPPPPEGETEAQRKRREQQQRSTRDMKPADNPDTYKTRGT